MTPTSSSPCPPSRFAVVGSGTWGITLAAVLAQNGHAVTCQARSADLIATLKATQRQPHLPHAALPASLVYTTDLAAALEAADACVLAIPSSAMRPICEAIRATGHADQIQAWIIVNKGIEQGTHMLMHEVLTDVLGAAAGARAGVLSGPSHAEELIAGTPTTVVACAADPALAVRIQGWFFAPALRVYTSDDVLGVELGGSIKNIIAIAAGISDGMGFGDNTRAALMTRGLAEMVRLGLALGARLETFMGLAGIGDLIVTAGSKHSRNHAFGELLAQGLGAQDALKKIGMVVEGYYNARSACQLAQRHGVTMPIAEAVYSVLYENVPPREAMKALLSREPKPEHY